QAKSFALKNPDRLVVDLVGVTNAVKNGSQSFETGPVSRVRVSQFKREPEPVVRVVADLRAKVPFKVESQDEDVVVVVGTPSATRSAPVESAARATGDAPAVDASIAGASSEPQAPAMAPATNTSPTYVPFTPVGDAAPNGAQPASDASNAGRSEGS